MKLNQNTVFTLIVLNLIFAGCVSQQTNVSATPMVLPTHTATPVPTFTPTLTPTAVGGSNGSVIQDDIENIVVVNPSTGEKKILISRAELETLLPKN